MKPWYWMPATMLRTMLVIMAAVYLYPETLVRGFQEDAAPRSARQVRETTQDGAAMQRLVLRDGSHEWVRGYSIDGDRLRYFSANRFEWEEMPASLVDWEATESQARGDAERAVERRRTTLEQAEEDRRAAEARRPWIAAGMRLPDPDNVYLLDVCHGESALVLLTQSGADLHKNLKRNILRGLVNPVSSSRQTIELEGLRSRIQSHALLPQIYVPIDPEDAMIGYDSKTARDHLRLVRCDVKKTSRIVMAYNIAVYGKVSVRARFVEAVVTAVSDYWVKIVPAAPLDPGEYALVEYDADGSVNQFVWDFGVDPAAPPNPNLRDPRRGVSEPVLMEKAAE